MIRRSRPITVEDAARRIQPITARCLVRHRIALSEKKRILNCIRINYQPLMLTSSTGRRCNVQLRGDVVSSPLHSAFVAASRSFFLSLGLWNTQKYRGHSIWNFVSTPQDPEMKTNQSKVTFLKDALGLASLENWCVPDVGGIMDAGASLGQSLFKKLSVGSAVHLRQFCNSVQFQQKGGLVFLFFCLNNS